MTSSLPSMVNLQSDHLKSMPPKIHSLMIPRPPHGTAMTDFDSSRRDQRVFGECLRLAPLRFVRLFGVQREGRYDAASYPQQEPCIPVRTVSYVCNVGEPRVSLSLAVQCLLSGVVPTGTASAHALRRSTDRPTSKWVLPPIGLSSVDG